MKFVNGAHTKWHYHTGEQTLLGITRGKTEWDSHDACGVKSETIVLPERPDYLAPDGSEIQLLPTMRGGGLAHCTLPPGGVSKPVYHRTVEEIWYCIEGDGKVWRRQDEREEVTSFSTGVSLTIPTGTHFRFRNTGDTPLRFIISTMPPWPGASEAVQLQGGYWDGWTEECEE